MHCRYYYTFRHVYAETYLALKMKKMKEKKKERKEKKARLHVRDSVAIVRELRWYRFSESWPGRWTVSLEIPMQPSPVVRTTAGAKSEEPEEKWKTLLPLLLQIHGSTNNIIWTSMMVRC